MFYRTLDPDHPANEGKEVERYKDVIPDLYAKMDAFLPEIQAKVGNDPDTVFMVISDHGFCNFRRGVNLNAWLRDEGYLVLKDGETTSGDWFQKVDWERTRAFTLGLTGIFLNKKGRERHGIVEPEDAPALCAELRAKLEALVDPKTGEGIMNEVFLTSEVHDGPYADLAPELLIGYKRGYRHSLGLRHGRGVGGGLQRQHQELVRRPLRRPAPRARRLLVQPLDQHGAAQPRGHGPDGPGPLRGRRPAVHAGRTALRRAPRVQQAGHRQDPRP